MLGSFLRAGYEIEATEPGRAQLIVVNTCGFLGAARDEVKRGSGEGRKEEGTWRNVMGAA